VSLTKGGKTPSSRVSFRGLPARLHCSSLLTTPSSAAAHSTQCGVSSPCSTRLQARHAPHILKGRSSAAGVKVSDAPAAYAAMKPARLPCHADACKPPTLCSAARHDALCHRCTHPEVASAGLAASAGSDGNLLRPMGCVAEPRRLRHQPRALARRMAKLRSSNTGAAATHSRSQCCVSCLQFWSMYFTGCHSPVVVACAGDKAGVAKLAIMPACSPDHATDREQPYTSPHTSKVGHVLYT
jgi:hypothetical protein